MVWAILAEVSRFPAMEARHGRECLPMCRINVHWYRISGGWGEGGIKCRGGAEREDTGGWWTSDGCCQSPVGRLEGFVCGPVLVHSVGHLIPLIWVGVRGSSGGHSCDRILNLWVKPPAELYHNCLWI